MANEDHQKEEVEGVRTVPESVCDWEVVELLLSLKRKKSVSSFECEQCKKTFLTCVALNIHNTKKHNKKKTRTDSTLDCPCGMTFTAKWRQNCVHKLNSHGRHCKAFKKIGNIHLFAKFFTKISLILFIFYFKKSAARSVRKDLSPGKVWNSMDSRLTNSLCQLIVDKSSIVDEASKGCGSECVIM